LRFFGKVGNAQFAFPLEFENELEIHRTCGAPPPMKHALVEGTGIDFKEAF
jgi:hypothetical protein